MEKEAFNAMVDLMSDPDLDSYCSSFVSSNCTLLDLQAVKWTLNMDSDSTAEQNSGFKNRGLMRPNRLQES